MKEEIKVGNVVKWKCRPYQRPLFIAEGIVRDIYQSTLGGMLKTTVARVEPVGEYKEVFPRRKTTTVGIDKLF